MYIIPPKGCIDIIVINTVHDPTSDDDIWENGIWVSLIYLGYSFLHTTPTHENTITTKK